MEEDNLGSDEVLDFIDNTLSNIMNITSTTNTSLKILADFMRVARNIAVEKSEQEEDAKFEEEANKYFS